MVSAASNIVVKVKVDPAGRATVHPRPPAINGRAQQIPVGKNPRGIVIMRHDRRAYVMNYVSRDVSVIDLRRNESVTATLLRRLPEPGTAEDEIQVGKELYNTSVGDFDPRHRGRTSRSPAACRTTVGAPAPPAIRSVLSDNVVWIFPSGPRRTIPQHTDFDRTTPRRPAGAELVGQTRRGGGFRAEHPRRLGRAWD